MDDELVAVVTVSLVSHRHGNMVVRLVERLLDFPEVRRVVVTVNVPEQLELPLDPRVLIVRNSAPKGFGENQNAAFEYCDTQYFCVLNPDIVFVENVFPHLLKCFADSRVGLVAPLVYSPTGEIEDSIRRFPSVLSVIARILGASEHGYVDSLLKDYFDPDWVAGMFMLFDQHGFSGISGFDQGFFMYYEDVDVCARVWRSMRAVRVCPHTRVIHDARRASRHNLRHMFWHLRSMIRYLAKYAFREVRVAETREGATPWGRG